MHHCCLDRVTCSVIAKPALGIGVVSLLDRWTGTEARLLRQALRLSMRAFAEHLGIAARTVAKWEAGGADVNPRPDNQAILDTVLSRADRDAQARFDALLEREQKPSSEDHALPTDPAAHTSAPHLIRQPAHEKFERADHEIGGDLGVRRREFIGTAAGVALALRIGSVDVANRITAGAVTELKMRAARLRKLDDHLGGGDTYSLYLSEFQSTAALARRGNYSEQVGRGLFSVMSEQAQQAGWAAFDAGWHREAKHLYELSRSIAEEANDSSLRGNALAFLAYQQASTIRRGAELAEQSCRVAGRHAHPAIRALLHERLAWGCAVAGQAAKTERALEEASEAINNSADQPPPDWAAWVDPTELEIMEGRCWVELHRPFRAVGTLERALTTYPNRHARDKALYLTALANAYYQGGEIEQAALTAGRALDLAAGVASARTAQHAAPLLRRLQAHAGLPNVAEVLSRASDPDHASGAVTRSIQSR